MTPDLCCVKGHEGASGLAGELGHLTVDPDGPRCNCGNGILTRGESLQSRNRETRCAERWLLKRLATLE